MPTEQTDRDTVGLDEPESAGATRRAAILKELEATVCANRVQAYGDPEDSFGDIAEFWNLYLGSRLSQDITERDVAIMQALLKVARLKANINHTDSWLDIAGYAICGGGLEDE
jgi:hypothetical protein